jgi:DNA-directed RNA polymerase subunit RPC12/RpoP
MSICQECKSILDISKTATATKKIFSIDGTPSEVSDTDEDKIHEIITQLANNKNISNQDNIKIEQFTNHDTFKNLDKQKRASILTKLEALTSKQDDSTAAYYKCKACGFTEVIKPGTLITSKIGTSSQINLKNIDKFKNKIYNRTEPRTRRFICPNKECPGKKDPRKHEAVMFRLDDSMQRGYICVACETLFIGQ